MTSRRDDPLPTVRRVADRLPEIPWLVLLDAVDDCLRLEQDAPYLAPLREAVVVARLRSRCDPTAA